MELLAELERWRLRPESFPEASQKLMDLPMPNLGEVTSSPVRSVYGLSSFVWSSVRIVLLAIAVCAVADVPSSWFVLSVAVLLRLFESLPFWLYKEPQHSIQSVAVPVEV